MFLEWGGTPEFVNWEDGPKFIAIDLSKLVADPDKYLKPKMYVKVFLDIDISYEEASFLRETFMEQYKIRELKLMPWKTDEYKDDISADLKFETVDEIVIDQLSNIESDNFDKKVLVDLYNRL